MTDIERETYVKKTCFEHWQDSECDSSDYYDRGKEDFRWWHYAKPDDLDAWSVEGTPLSELVTQPKAWLVLNGLYAQNAEAYWEEGEEEE